MRTHDIIKNIKTNIGGHDFVINLRTNGRFYVEGGLNVEHDNADTLADIKTQIQKDITYTVEHYGSPYLTRAEYDLIGQQREAAKDRDQQREVRAEKAATAAELGRVTDTYIFDGLRLEEVRVRGVSAKDHSRGFNVTTRSTGEKSQDRSVYRLTPSLVFANNAVIDQQAALDMLTEDVPRLEEPKVSITPDEDGGWTVKVKEGLPWERRRDEPKVYATHKVTFDEESGAFIADDATISTALANLGDMLAVDVHPSLGKWMIYNDDGVPAAVEITPTSLYKLGRRYRYVDVVDNEVAANTLLSRRQQAAELDNRANLIRRRIMDHPSYERPDRNDLANWPVLDVDILPENEEGR